MTHTPEQTTRDALVRELTTSLLAECQTQADAIKLAASFAASLQVVLISAGGLEFAILAMDQLGHGAAQALSGRTA